MYLKQIGGEDKLCFVGREAMQSFCIKVQKIEVTHQCETEAW